MVTMRKALRTAATRGRGYRRSMFAVAIAIIAGLLASAVGGIQAAPLTAPLSRPLLAQEILRPTGLAWVSSAQPGTNFGGQGQMWVG